jgi:phytoene dehydrogenase-like protein
MTDYDAVVIGSGSGGLTAAVALANAGRRVVVFEQHYLPGGYSQSFTLRGYRFSPGVHYVGQLGPGEGLRRMYEGLGVADDLVFFEINPDGYDHAIVGNERFDIPKGVDNFRSRLKERFPAESRGIDGYFEMVERIANELAWASPPRSLKDTLLLPKRMWATLRFGMMPLGRCLDRFTDDPLLRAILSIQAGDHGMAPSRAPMALHAGLQSYYFNGACYPRGGGHAIPDALIRRLKSQGGEIHLRTDVARVIVRGGRAAGVRLADGREVSAGLVVSNADPGTTWGRLVPQENVPYRLRHRLRHLRYSISTLSLFMAVDMDVRAAGLDSGNIWYSSSPDVDAAYELAQRADLSHVDEIPGLFFNVTTLKDPTMRKDGIHTIEVLALASPDAFARWRDTNPAARPEDYEAMKDYLADKMLDAVERFVPGLRRHVVFRALGTPLTNIHYLHASRGAIYGTENTIRNLGPFSFPVRTVLPGLFQCGASTLSPGIHGVTKSGLAAAAAALDCGEEELLASKSGPLRVYSAEDPSSWASSEGQETGDADQLDGLGLPLRWNDDLDRMEVAP